jgi:hypothetical protein
MVKDAKNWRKSKQLFGWTTACILCHSSPLGGDCRAGIVQALTELFVIESVRGEKNNHDHEKQNPD